MDSYNQPVLDLTPGWMNSAGFLGWYLPENLPLAQPPVAFVTPPVSLHPRKPAGNRTVLSYSGGVLLHSGLPNPGLNRVLQKYVPIWTRSQVPVWIHLLSDNPDDIHSMVLVCETIEAIRTCEVSIPCKAHPSDVRTMIQAAAGEMPVVLQLPLDRVQEHWIPEIGEWGVRAISIGAPRGTMIKDGNLINGRLYGPSIFPQALAVLSTLREAKLPIIISGGVFSQHQLDFLLQAGAAAVQLDLVLWNRWLDSSPESV